MPDTLKGNRSFLIIGVFSALIVLLWGFPYLWYRGSDAHTRYFWLSENGQVAGWTFREVPVSESAEKVLVADQMVNGEFAAGGRQVRVFSAKRYRENQNEIGLFVHTPDRCWTQAGWKIEATNPSIVKVDLHGIRIPFERRIFHTSGHRELVYFAGLTGGQPLPYRLDHNLSVAMKYQLAEKSDVRGTALRIGDNTLWARLWDSFTNRRQLLGPKQFLRISTPAPSGADVAEADKLLTQFIQEWLSPTDYEAELQSWNSRQLAATE